jgi:hypothetical protein
MGGSDGSYACLCNWDECREIRRLLFEHQGKEDVWCQQLHFVRINALDHTNISDKVLALRASIVRHVPGFEGLKDDRTFVLAPHHFPRALLDFRKKHAIKLITAQITPFQMGLIVKDDISSRLKEGCDSVGAILSPIWRHLSKIPDKSTKVANTSQVSYSATHSLPRFCQNDHRYQVGGLVQHSMQWDDRRE